MSRKTAHTANTSIILKILDGLRKNEDVLRDKVEKKRRMFLREGVPETEVKQRLIKSYVSGALVRSTTASVAGVLPWEFPLIGTISTFLLVVGANTLYIFKNELELCYLIAFSANSDLSGEALKHRAFWLVGLSDYEEIKKQAKLLGVQITVKKLVEKLAVASLSHGIGHFFSHGLGESMGLGINKRFGFFVGAPISGFYSYRSTSGVAERAIKYFNNP